MPQAKIQISVIDPTPYIRVSVRVESTIQLIHCGRNRASNLLPLICHASTKHCPHGQRAIVGYLQGSPDSCDFRFIRFTCMAHFMKVVVWFYRQETSRHGAECGQSFTLQYFLDSTMNWHDSVQHAGTVSTELSKRRDGMMGKQSTLILLMCAFLAGCSTAQVTLRKDKEGAIFPNKIPLGALRVMQVLNVEKVDVLKDPIRYEQFLRSAMGFISPYWNARDESQSLSRELSATMMPDSIIESGYLVVGRVYCCGGVQETVNRQYAFSPVSLPVNKDAFVEVRFGHNKPGEINMITRTVNDCNWVPRDPRLWVRIPYCNWMKGDEWMEVSSMITSSNHAWIKAPSNR